MLSMEARITLRRLGMSKFSYLLDRIYATNKGGSVDMTSKELCTVTGLTRRIVEDALNLDAVRAKFQLPERTRKAETETLDHVHGFETILGVMYSYYVKTVHMLRQYESKVYHLPSSEELDTALGIQHPTHIRVRLDSYLRYKADITQFKTVKNPGRLSYSQIAQEAGVSGSTVRRHEKIAETKVIRHYASVPYSQWHLELPEDYQDYMEHDKKFTFRGAWLEFNGNKEPYAKTGYRNHLLRGGTKETIEVKWNKSGDHFPREGLSVEMDSAEVRAAFRVFDAETLPKIIPFLFSTETRPVPAPIMARFATV